MAELSPMMQQYFEIKEKNKDCIVFFRLGDFYEMFFDDAKLASKELELTLTGRDCGQEERAPMCGVPFHSAESYIARLVQKGYKVAICEQTEDPKAAKGIVKRDIIRVITPGTVMESSMLDESENNYICSMYADKNYVGIVFCDISTGQLFVSHFKSDHSFSQLKDQLTSYSPKELLIAGKLAKNKVLHLFIKEKLSNASVTHPDDSRCGLLDCTAVVENHFSKENTDKISGMNEVVIALGVLMSYLKDTQMTGLERIDTIEFYAEDQYMKLDFNTRRNLELTRTMIAKEKKHSLLWVLDKTKTAMGKRLMKFWVEHPLMNITAILKRQNAVEELVNDTVNRLELTANLSGIFDIERLMTKIVYGSANARELRSLCQAMTNLPTLKATIEPCKSKLLHELFVAIDPLDDMRALIDEAIVEDPPFSVREGGLIKEGYSAPLDELKRDMTDSTSLLARIEAEQKELTGIPKLKVGYNRVFGYYIEVTKSYLHLVPENYSRRQTLTNCERFITPELKELESRILGAKERSVAIEYELFNSVREQVALNLDRIERTAKAIATLDVLVSLANVAADNRYTRPEVTQNSIIRLKDSRHPVVETLLSDAMFVPNDVLLDNIDNRIAIITGPNMAGKSTYMRQVALIVLMAQMGSFVPASYAEVGMADAIFTRVGASDDLASGQSTFMVEMNEVANIVQNATSKSLLILDEIGRGTSTYDGMSIARAVLEYVADKKKLGARALFATHYHELTVMEELLDGVKNYNIAVKKRGDEITFLRRIVPGGADESYGVEVAKLAGLPDSIIERAKEILLELNNAAPKEHQTAPAPAPEESMQLSLMPDSSGMIEKKLRAVDVNTLTPIEAMNILYELKGMID
ncbi:MAG: DNA mismatch repair protein MutS [Ruminococcus sp.]|uniref:DNA mismatch repair protein MutS n=1 Tax=Ruminococcus sp. TaxID=41978 RepID=UPI00287344C2|nr:DNA mismatch repair protein MutS [Ruminococcus sp.]MBQ3284972.1 DNA mismatch repair protein MutS [Ruminococcus sp.]